MTERGPAADAELALLLEVAGTPKPGNVDRHRDLAELRFEHFLAGAVGAREGLAAAADGAAVGAAFERAVAGMATHSGGNSQFGALLLLVPLVRAAGKADAGDGEEGITRRDAAAVAEATDVEDAVGFYRAFEHVEVFVGDPPPDAAAPDVRDGADAVPALRERGLSLWDVMADDGGGVAGEWVGGFERTFDAAEALLKMEGPAPDRAAAVYLELLAAEPDWLVARKHGPEVAETVVDRAREARAAGPDQVEALADELVEEGVNPGATADLVAGALFVALRRGLEV